MVRRVVVEGKPTMTKKAISPVPAPEEERGRDGEGAAAAATGAVVVRSDSSCSTFRSLVAITLWVGPFFLNILLAVAALLLRRSSASLWIIGVLVLMILIPVDDKSKFGRALANFVGKHVPGYFPVTVHIEDAKAFNQNKSYVLATEPHSIFPIGCLSLLNITGLMPLAKTKALASTAVFYTPFLRQITTWMGLVSATKKNFVDCLKAGNSCIVIPGGVQEIVYMNRDYEVAYLKRRHGFVRVAIETGSPLVPVFCFGQSDVFNWWKPEGKLYIRITKAIRFAPLIFWGTFGLPIPYRKPIHIVVGKPLEFEQNTNPSSEEVAQVHARYVSSLERLFLEYRKVAGHADTELRIL